MPGAHLPTLLVVALLIVAGPAQAAPAAAEPAAAESCPLPRGAAHPLANRQETLERYERLPAACLKEVFRQCSEAARGTLLDLGSAAGCSLGYEALLRQVFGGDFKALLAWWRSNG